MSDVRGVFVDASNWDAPRRAGSPDDPIQRFTVYIRNEQVRILQVFGQEGPYGQTFLDVITFRSTAISHPFQYSSENRSADYNSAAHLVHKCAG